MLCKSVSNGWSDPVVHQKSNEKAARQKGQKSRRQECIEADENLTVVEHFAIVAKVIVPLMYVNRRDENDVCSKGKIWWSVFASLPKSTAELGGFCAADDVENWSRVFEVRDRYGVKEDDKGDEVEKTYLETVYIHSNGQVCNKRSAKAAPTFGERWNESDFLSWPAAFSGFHKTSFTRRNWLSCTTSWVVWTQLMGSFRWPSLCEYRLTIIQRWNYKPFY